MGDDRVQECSNSQRFTMDVDNMGDNRDDRDHMDIDGLGTSIADLHLREQSQPYCKLILTDLEDHAEDANNENSVALHKEKNKHVAILKNGGAQGPTYDISGFQSASNSQFTDYAKMTIYDIGMVYWGSPHWSDNADHDTRGIQTSDDFKTNAWESMRWLSKNSFNCITFGEKYKVEFYAPQWKEKGEKEVLPRGRRLIVGEGYFREYEPLGSGGERETISEGLPTYVAMLVPARFWGCLHYKDEKIDFGQTCWAVLNKLAPMERAIELGGQTFSLSYEIHLAKLEQEQSQSRGSRQL